MQPVCAGVDSYCLACFVDLGVVLETVFGLNSFQIRPPSLKPAKCKNNKNALPQRSPLQLVGSVKDRISTKDALKKAGKKTGSSWKVFLARQSVSSGLKRRMARALRPLGFRVFRPDTPWTYG